MCLMALSIHAQGYVDLGLPSGTLWKSVDENGLFNHNNAMKMFGNNLPSEAQFKELKEKCEWRWNGSGYTVTGPNGNSIEMNLYGGRQCEGNITNTGEAGYYWGSEYDYGNDIAMYLYVTVDGGTGVGYHSRCQGFSVRLVRKK